MQPPAAQVDRDAAIEFLRSRIDYERTLAMPYGQRDFKLDRMHELLARLGDPHADLRIVHVAGTKGKGSTAAMIAAIATAAGNRTGLYTSPHLDRVEERLAIDGEPCSTEDLVDLILRVRPVVAQMDAARAGEPGTLGPTYFEVLTALALLHFAERRVDLAVLEVGLGGRLDSTNVCQPEVAVITSISFDHMQQLGNTLAAIAAEKAGIIKPRIPVVSGVTGDEPRRVIEEVARRNESLLLELGRDFDVAYYPPEHLETASELSRLDFVSRAGGRTEEYRNVALNLLGKHQSANAAVALATIGQLRRAGWDLDESAARQGLAQVRWPARIEVVSRRPVVVLDAAHNVASVEAFVRALDESFSTPRRILVFATTKDKDAAGMLRIVLPKFDRVIFTRYRNNPRGVPPEELEALARQSSPTPCTVAADPSAAWREAAALARPEDLIGITGSFFIAAEIRSSISGRGR